MPATIICNPVWRITELEHTENLPAVVNALFAVMERDGVDEACETLCRYPCWSVINENTDSSPDWLWPENENIWKTKLIEGYGLAYDDRDAGFETGELDGVLGIFCDGSMMYTDFEEDESIPIDPSKEDPLAKLEAFLG